MWVYLDVLGIQKLEIQYGFLLGENSLFFTVLNAEPSYNFIEQSIVII